MLGFLPLTYVASLAGFTWTMRPWLATEKQRQWVLSTAVNTIVSAVGLYQFAYWWFTGTVTATAGTNAMIDILQAYMIVDLVYNAWYYGPAMNLLEFWVHHVVYIAILGVIRTTGYSGYVRPFYILELPSAVRAWGTMVPAWRSDAWFGTLFATLRVGLPFYNLAVMWDILPLWSIPVILTMQGMHCYWMLLWIRNQLQQMPAPPIAS